MLALSGLAFFWQLGSIGLVDETEPLFAEAARQMLETGDWITPYFNGATRFDKPPLIYWLMAIAYQVVGTNEWGARLPSAIAGLGAVAFGFATLVRFGRPSGDRAASPSKNRAASLLEHREASPPETRPDSPPDHGATLPPEHPQDFPPEQGEASPLETLPASGTDWPTALTAALGAAAIALNPETIAWGRVGVSDMLLTGCLTAALLAFFWGYAASSQEISRGASREVSQEALQEASQTVARRWYWVFYGAIALAILTKGPVGLVLPAGIVGAFALYCGEGLALWRELRPLRGLALVLAISVPWFVAVIARHGEAYTQTFFGYHNFERFARVVNQHSAPWYFYFLVVAAGFLPWSAYLPWALGRLRLWRPGVWRRQPRADRLGLFAATWFLGIFAFFTLSATKLPSYVLPLMPAGGILTALAWRSLAFDRPPAGSPGRARRARQTARMLGGTSVAIALVLAIAMAAGGWWVSQIEDPTMPNLAARVTASGVLARGAVIWAIAAIGGTVLTLRGQARWSWPANGVAFALFFALSVLPATAIVDSQRQLPLRQLAARAAEVRLPGEPLLAIGDEKPSLVFYTRQSVAFHQQAREAIAATADRQASGEWTAPTVLVLGDREKLAETGLGGLGDALAASGENSSTNSSENSDMGAIAEAGVFRLLRLPVVDFVNHPLPEGDD